MFAEHRNINLSFAVESVISNRDLFNWTSLQS